MDFGNHLKQLRKKLNLSQKNVADELHLTRQAISQWENNKTYPDVEKLYQLSQLYQCDLEELLSESKGDSRTSAKLSSQLNMNLFVVLGMILQGFIALVGMLTIPLFVWQFKQKNKLNKAIIILCSIVFLYNAVVTLSLILDVTNWGTTSISN